MFIGLRPARGDGSASGSAVRTQARGRRVSGGLSRVRKRVMGLGVVIKDLSYIFQYFLPYYLPHAWQLTVGFLKSSPNTGPFSASCDSQVALLGAVFATPGSPRMVSLVYELPRWH